MKFVGGSVMTAPTSIYFTEADAEWMRRMGYKEDAIDAERERRRKLREDK